MVGFKSLQKTPLGILKWVEVLKLKVAYGVSCAELFLGVCLDLTSRSCIVVENERSHWRLAVFLYSLPVHAAS